MKIVVVGGSGLIGSRVVARLSKQGHDVVSASPSTGVNVLTGEGIAKALEGAAVVVDVTNSPSFEEAVAVKFFETSTPNLLAAEAAAGVGHHVALSVVGSERMAESGYFRAKIRQEQLIEESSIPYSIVRATQFFEFANSIADAATEGRTVHLAPVLIQPIAASDVASAVARVAVGAPLGGTVEIGGPERLRLDDFIRRALAARNDPREIVVDPHARFFGWFEVTERTLIPGDGATLGETRLGNWLAAVPAPMAPSSPDASQPQRR